MLTIRSLVAVFALSAACAHADNWRILEGDRYTDVPAAADATGRAACQPPHRYVELINAGLYDQIGALFAANAVFMPPTGEVLRGPKEIGDFYKKFLGKVQPKVVPISFIGDGAHCVMELAAMESANLSTGYQLSAVDHFVVDASGKVSQMIVYLRPQQMPRILHK